MKVLAIFVVFIALAAALPAPQISAENKEQQSALLSVDSNTQTDNAERSKRFLFFKKFFIPFPISITTYVQAPVAVEQAPIPVVTPIVQKTVVAAPVVQKTVYAAPAPVVYAAPVVHETVAVAAPVVHKTVTVAAAPVAYAAPAPVAYAAPVPVVHKTILVAPAPVAYAAPAPVVHKTVAVAPAPVVYSAPAAISASIHLPSISVSKTYY